MPSTQPPCGFRSRRVLIIPALFFLLMAAMPWIGGWAGRGGPGQPDREVLGELLGSVVILALGGWILKLIHREQVYTLRHLRDLEHLTLTDPLTGLANRRALEHDLPLALKRSERLQEPLALLYMDVDHFKQLNDRFGHAIGDETLRSLGAVLRSCSRSGTDVAYRVGGDEFVMVAVADPAGAEMLARRLERDFRDRSPRRSEVSLGVVMWDGQAGAPEILARADLQMYRAKGTAGRRFA